MMSHILDPSIEGSLSQQDDVSTLQGEKNPSWPISLQRRSSLFLVMHLFSLLMEFVSCHKNV